MTLYENEEVTLAERSEEGDTSLLDAHSGDQDEIGEEKNEEISIETNENIENDGREEYERLIKGRFKAHFAADAQKLINRRFKKYKLIEEKLARLEEEAAHYADVEKLIAEERAAAIKETEDRMTRQFRSNRARAEENALTARSAHPSFDVSRLTRSERALLAKRAQKGEKIHLKY